jgi:hypothetical protein
MSVGPAHWQVESSGSDRDRRGSPLAPRLAAAGRRLTAVTVPLALALAVTRDRRRGGHRDGPGLRVRVRVDCGPSPKAASEPVRFGPS